MWPTRETGFHLAAKSRIPITSYKAMGYDRRTSRVRKLLFAPQAFDPST
jgi:hypothetical protein